MSPPKEKKVDLAAMMERFHSEDKCHSYLEHIRWPDGVCCVRCGNVEVSRIKTRRVFQCDACDYQFSVRVGTILHDSHLPLWKWFFAIYMMCESKKGISANQLKRMLSVSYKTAWYLCHRIRAAMKDEAPEQLRGIVEVDETFVGSRNRGHVNRRRGAGSKDHLAMVVGAVERGGRVRVAMKPSRSRKHLHAFIDEHVHDDASEIHTDAWPPYVGIEDANTKHRVVNHSESWVSADVHTNTIEGVWSLFKRSIVGSYHKLSVKHMPAYLDEMAFRYNNRDNPFMFRDVLKRLIEADPLSYKELIGKEKAA